MFRALSYILCLEVLLMHCGSKDKNPKHNSGNLGAETDHLAMPIIEELDTGIIAFYKAEYLGMQYIQSKVIGKSYRLEYSNDSFKSDAEIHIQKMPLLTENLEKLLELKGAEIIGQGIDIRHLESTTKHDGDTISVQDTYNVLLTRKPSAGENFYPMTLFPEPKSNKVIINLYGEDSFESQGNEESNAFSSISLDNDALVWFISSTKKISTSKEWLAPSNSKEILSTKKQDADPPPKDALEVSFISSDTTVFIGSRNQRIYQIYNRGEFTASRFLLQPSSNESFEITDSDCPAEIPPEEDCLFTLNWQADAEGAFTFPVIFSYNYHNADNSKSWTLTSKSSIEGLALEPGKLDIEPATLQFGNVAAGQQSSLSLKLKNSGSFIITQISGSIFQPFTVDWNTCGSGEIPPLFECNVIIVFTPPLAESYSANFVVGYNGGDAIHQKAILVQGNGI